MLTKQSSQAAFKITKAGAKVGAKASAKVAQVVVDISEKVTSSYGMLPFMCAYFSVDYFFILKQ